MLQENYAFTRILITGVIQTWLPFQCDRMNIKVRQISVIIHWEIITKKKLPSVGQNTQQRHNANLKYGQEYCYIPIFMPTLKKKHFNFFYLRTGGNYVTPSARPTNMVYYQIFNNLWPSVTLQIAACYLFHNNLKIHFKKK